tara:strand:- start:211510 stop:212088 length:579 start_codon:yes stop_codon:yes gene_type:complete
MPLINGAPLPLLIIVLLLPYAADTASQPTSQRLNRLLAPFEIEADLREGEALLHGEVDSEIERDLAEELAAGIDGVEEVKNQLDVRPADSSVYSREAKPAFGSDSDGRLSDAFLTLKVKLQLVWSRHTDGLSITVDTVNGQVTLEGSVESEAESLLAEQIARETAGVIQVENRLEVARHSAGDFTWTSSLTS